MEQGGMFPLLIAIDLCSHRLVMLRGFVGAFALAATLCLGGCNPAESRRSSENPSAEDSADSALGRAFEIRAEIQLCVNPLRSKDVIEEETAEALARNFGLSLEEFHELIETGRKSPNPLERAYAESLSNRPADARRLAEDSKIEPGITTAQVMAAERIIAQASFELKDYESMRAALERILALHNRSADPLAWSDARYEVGRMAFWTDVPEEHTLEKVVAFKEREFGSTHPSLVGPLVDLAILADQSDEEIESLPLLERARGIMSVHGEDVPVYAMRWTLGALSLEYGRSESLPQKEDCYRRALEVTTAFLGEEHTQVAWALENLGGVRSAQGKLEGSESAYRRALSIVDAKLGRHHREARMP